MSIIKNAVRDPGSGAVISTDTGAANRARIRRKVAIEQKQKERVLKEQDIRIEKLEAMVRSLMKGNNNV